MVSVDFLVSYMKSIPDAQKYTTEGMIKGKMSAEVTWNQLKHRPPAQVLPWSAPPVNTMTLSVDG